jgi:hypothetical protein
MKGAGTTLAYIFPGCLLGRRGVGGRGHHAHVALGGMKGSHWCRTFQCWAKMFAISSLHLRAHGGAWIKEKLDM